MCLVSKFVQSANKSQTFLQLHCFSLGQNAEPYADFKRDEKTRKSLPQKRYQQECKENLCYFSIFTHVHKIWLGHNLLG